MTITLEPAPPVTTDCSPMKIVGPTVPRMVLCERIVKLREAAGLTQDDISKALEISVSLVRKLESGDRKISAAQLIVMLDRYGVDDAELRDFLHDMRRRIDQRGWWAEYGSLGDRFETFLGLEGSATTIRSFEAVVIPGLLQTEAYARAIAMRDRRIGELSAEQANLQVEIKHKRQNAVFGEGNTPTSLHVILDEAVVRRVVGGPEVMGPQLAHLAEMAKNPAIRIQVVPYDQGAHPGMFGAFEVFEFDEELHSPIVYVEGQAGSLYLEKAGDLTRCNLAWTDLVACAMSPQDSVRMITRLARELGA